MSDNLLPLILIILLNTFSKTLLWDSL